MSAPTPGQLAYEARRAAKGRRLGATDDTPDHEIVRVTGHPWEDLPPGQQADEEAGAQAVLNQAFPGLRKQLADQREAYERQHLELLQARGEKDDLAARADNLRAHLTEVLGWFHGTGDGFRARVSGVRLTREYTRAGLPVPDRLSHLAGQ